MLLNCIIVDNFIMSLLFSIVFIIFFLCKNKITRSSIFEYLLLKGRITCTQYFAKNPVGTIRLKQVYSQHKHNIKFDAVQNCINFYKKYSNMELLVILFLDATLIFSF